MRRDSASDVTDPRSQRPRACSKRSLYGNREIPEATERVPRPVRSGQAEGRNTDMNATGKSDSGVVSVKRTNKGAQPNITGQPPTESVEKSSGAKGNSAQTTMTGTPRPEAMSSGLDRVREAAKKDSKQRFTNLLHHITIDLLRDSYYSLKRTAAAGVDGVTWGEYGEGLEERLPGLHERIQSGRYRTRPSKRAWIPKPDGSQRPIGIAALEDKIVQQALVQVLQAIYEEDFIGFSYGSRPERSQHDALDAIYVAITKKKVGWVLDADIKGFYDSVDHGWMMKFLKHRIADPRVVRLIGKFLRAGVSEEGEWTKTVVGTPQGAVISSILANLYLHYVLDQWVIWWRKCHARGEVYIVRYVDDFVMGFQHCSDARRFRMALKERLLKFGMELHEGKTRLIEFGRFAEVNRKERKEGKPETFDFLGFTHICAKRRKDGSFTILRKTIAKKFRAKVEEVREKLMRNRHKPLPEQGSWLKSVVQGHYNYYGVPGNRKALDSFRTLVNKAWIHALRRRSQKARSLPWEKHKRWIERWIPKARIVHPYPDMRFCV